MKKIIFLILISFIFVLINAKVGAIFVSHYNFEDIEYIKVTEALEKDSITYFVFSSTLDTCIGLYGTKVVPYITLDSVDTDIIDFLIIIDGPGIIEYLDNKQLISIIQKVNEQNKLIGGIKMSPALFMSADIVRNKKLNIFLNDFIFEKYKDYKVTYVTYDVYKMDNIITAYDDEYLNKFMFNFIKVLNEDSNPKSE